MILDRVQFFTLIVKEKEKHKDLHLTTPYILVVPVVFIKAGQLATA
jgi:hypothetical protein